MSSSTPIRKPRKKTVIRIAKSPFDDTTASIILRSCDNVNFYVYKEILKAASSFFRTMFSLPQPSLTPGPSTNPTSSSTDEVSPEGLPIIPIPEDSETLDYILRLCYPLRAPARLATFFRAEKVLTAALKYEIDKVVDLAKSDLTELGKGSPFPLYMLACKFELEDSARLAADLLRQTHQLSSPPTEKDFVRLATKIYRDEYSQLPAIFLYRLLQYISAGEQQSVPSFSNTGVQSAEADSHVNQSNGSKVLPPDLADVLSKHQADVLLQSSDGIIVPAHKVILRVASGEAILSQAEADDCPRKDDFPLVSVSLTGAALTQLVRACYFPPNCHEDSHMPEDDLRLVYAAEGFGMHRVATMAKERWLSHLQKDPLSSYFVACLNGWASEACEALRYMASEGIPASTGSVPIMSKPGTAKYYFAYLQLYNSLHGVEDLKLENTKFARLGQETWGNPSYACSASITPIVVCRALNAVHTRRCTNHNTTLGHPYYGRQSHANSPVDLADPPTSVPSPSSLSFTTNPAGYIRAMVQESKLLDESRRECIEAIDMTAIVQAAGL